ncbi:SRPBCC family protein [Sphaerisporangium dianthi]|uniref:SRPBCC family protein n=1 Tax=Sphaerisporangium dianthi TaxID=1436120 RepID=A0ABV9CT90_9ACTN
MRKVGMRARVALDARAALDRLAGGSWSERLTGDVLSVTPVPGSPTVPGESSAPGTPPVLETPPAPASETPLVLESPPGTETAPGRPVSPAASAGVGRDGDRLSEWALPFRGGTVRWRQYEQAFPARADASSPAPGIAFEQVDGDFATLSGTWHVVADPGGASCQVLFEARFDLGVPMYDRVVEPLLARVIARAVRAVLVAAYGSVEAEEDPPTVPEAERRVASLLAAATA